MKKDYLKLHSEMKSIRAPLEREWQDVRELVRPYGKDFSRVRGSSDPMVNQIYDGTAPDALEQLAAGLHSFLTNPVERWFTLDVTDQIDPLDDEALMWLEDTSDKIYAVYANDQTKFNQSIHECFLDLGGFGNCILSQEWNKEISNPIFEAIAPAAAWFDTDDNGSVKIFHQERELTWFQILTRYGASALFTEQLRAATERPFEKQKVLHRIAPRNTRDPLKADPRNMKFESVHLLMKEGTVLEESGYNDFPRHVSRWVTLSGECYGRSPATKCLPDIRMLNQIEKTMIRAAQKACDPPIILENDSIIQPLKTSPGSIMWKEPGTEQPMPFPTTNALPITLEMSNQKRQFIQSCFYADWLRMEKLNKEMTATEVMDRREEKLRLIAPLLGRQQSELLGPIISRTLGLLQHYKRLRPMPESLKGRIISVAYTSPAARAQTGVKAVTISRYIQDILPLAQADPKVLDQIDFVAVAEELALARGVTRKIIRSAPEVKKLQDERAKQQQMAQMAQVAEPASKAMLNVAQARQSGMDVAPLLNAIAN